jgi:hypothetical protein
MDSVTDSAGCTMHLSALDVQNLFDNKYGIITADTLVLCK